MTKETQFIKNKHDCGTVMKLMQSPIEKEVWIIYGVCEKCKVVILLSLFLQDTMPIKNVDYIVEKGIVENTKEFTTSNVKKYLLKTEATK